MQADNSAKNVKARDQFCGEHRHDVRNFASLNARLKAPDAYRSIYDYRVRNLARVAKTSVFTLGSMAVAGTLAVAAGPAIGGLIGTYAFGLSGAAATSAGLALMGGGALATGGFGMAGGLLFATAIGTAVGGKLGGYVAGQYLSDVKDFDVYKVRSGKKPAIITVNGFLSARGELHTGWVEGIDKHYPDHEWYHVEWEAKNLATLGAYCIAGPGSQALRVTLTEAAKQASKKAASSLGGPVAFAQIVLASTNPWHVALVKAEKTGALLADILQRCDRQRFILLGHSLGSRVIFSCLQSLATTKKKRIAGVHMFGGAVDNGTGGWQATSNALTPGATICNYHSDDDQVLRYLYRVGTFFNSVPIGQHPIQRVATISNHNVSGKKFGHMDYKRRLQEISLGM